MKIGIIEAGSTNTKCYIVDDLVPTLINVRGIGFKDNYIQDGHIRESDIAKLSDCVKGLMSQTESVHIFGTSIFRQADIEEIDNLRSILKKLGNVSFEVVTAEMEGEYTAFGAMTNIIFDGPVAIMVGGGGSTELFVYQDNKILAKALSPIGVGDVNKAYPDLFADIASTEPIEIIDWISKRLMPISQKAELLVLAGGDFPLLYKNVGYNLRSNIYSDDPEKPYMLSNVDKLNQDKKYFFDISINKLRSITPDNPGWWDGTRAMCCFVSAVAQQLQAKTLIPTRISMIYGMIHHIQNSKIST